MSEVALHNVRKFYGEHLAVDGVNLEVSRGEFVTLLGPSGCGKTTCLRMIAGFVTPTSGQVLIAGQDVTNLPAHRRNTGMVFQSYALFPHLTVAANVAFGLKVRRISRVQREQRTREALRLVRLEAFADRYPSQLSGGQRQRVALARAVVINPEILLLDEPLGALDFKLREELQIEIKRIQSELNVTTLFVTHDQGEALSMSSRIAVMQLGKIVQIGTPDEIYERPTSQYVANFVGKINFISVVVTAKEGANYRVAPAVSRSTPSTSSSFVVSHPQSQEFKVGDQCVLAVRPEYLHLGSRPDANETAITITSRTYLGNVWQIEGTGPAGEAVILLVRPGEALPAGGSAKMHWRSDHCFLLTA
jgi:spermidine/putrescine ABC transporter ATP-binding subunit